MPNVELRISEAFSPQEKNILNSRGAWGGTWGGHAVPNLIDFARYGTSFALRDKVRKHQADHPEAKEFYDGILILLDAIDILGNRIHASAVEQYRTAQGDTRRKSARLARTFSTCPRLPASTLPMLVQFLCFCSLWMESILLAISISI